MSSEAGSRRKRSDDDEIFTRMREWAVAIERVARKWEQAQSGENILRSVAIYPPKTQRLGQWLIIGKSWAGGYKMVAFHRNTSLLLALCGFFLKAEQGTLDWKRDKWDEEA